MPHSTSTPSPSRRSRWLARTLLIPLTLLTVGVQSACVALTESKACPEFKDAMVDTRVSASINVMGVGVTLGTFTDVASFDTAVLNATAFMSASDCTGYNSTERVRYQNTVLCAMIVGDQNSSACKANPPSMCTSSCLLYADALSKMVEKVCPTATAAKEGATGMLAICNGPMSDWGGLHETSTYCINATTNDAFCGFGNQASMCTFCGANAADTCCASTAASAGCVPLTTTTTLLAPSSPAAASPTDNSGSNSTSGAAVPPANTETSTSGEGGGLSTAALGGIIGGGAGFLLGCFALIICCIRRNRTGPAHAGGAKGGSHLARHVSNSSVTKYNISGPKIQEEGFSSGMAPSAPIPMTALPSLGGADANAGLSAASAAAAANRLSRGSNVSGANGGKPSFCKVIYPYHASMADEMDLAQSDIVNVHRVFDDGWAVGINMNTSCEGAFPVVCVVFVDEASLEDDFEDVNMHAMTPMGHREDEFGPSNGNGRGSPRSSMPSRASSPVHLPRRQSSMIRDSTLIPGVNSPLQSSPLAGGNLSPNNLMHHNGSNNSFPRIQSPVRDTMLSDASSVNRWFEGEGTSTGKR